MRHERWRHLFSGLLRPILAAGSFFATLVSVVSWSLCLLLALYLGYWQIACVAAGFVFCNLEGTAKLCSQHPDGAPPTE